MPRFGYEGFQTGPALEEIHALEVERKARAYTMRGIARDHLDEVIPDNVFYQIAAEERTWNAEARARSAELRRKLH